MNVFFQRLFTGFLDFLILVFLVCSFIAIVYMFVDSIKFEIKCKKLKKRIERVTQFDRDFYSNLPIKKPIDWSEDEWDEYKVWVEEKIIKPNKRVL